MSCGPAWPNASDSAYFLGYYDLGCSQGGSRGRNWYFYPYFRLKLEGAPLKKCQGGRGAIENSQRGGGGGGGSAIGNSTVSHAFSALYFYYLPILLLKFAIFRPIDRLLFHTVLLLFFCELPGLYYYSILYYYYFLRIARPILLFHNVLLFDTSE